ncbi:MAG: hypothetical protein SPJ19_03550 [Candidatus Borkfalkiaceae bacterium]|nr:hypothetical protein [Christensenellaceae bacterium]
MTKLYKKTAVFALAAVAVFALCFGIKSVKTAVAKNVDREFSLTSNAEQVISGVETLTVDTAKYKYLAIELHTISSGVTDTYTPFQFIISGEDSEKKLIMATDYMTSAEQYPAGFSSADYYFCGNVRVASTRINYLTSEKGYAIPNKVNGSVAEDTVWFTVKKDFNGKVFIYLPDYFDKTFSMSDLKVNTDGSHKPTFTIGDIFFAENIAKNADGGYTESGSVKWFETGTTVIKSTAGQETTEFLFNSPQTVSSTKFLAIDMKIDSLTGTTDTFTYFKFYLKSGDTYYNLSLPTGFASLTTMPEGMTASQFQNSTRIKGDRINCYTTEGSAYSVPNKGNATSSNYVIKKAFNGTFYIWLGDFFTEEKSFDGLKIYHSNIGYIQNYTIRQMYFCSDVKNADKTRIDYTEGKIVTDKANVETNGVKLTVAYTSALTGSKVTIDLTGGNIKVIPTAPEGYKGALTVNGKAVYLTDGVYTAETEEAEIAVNFTAKINVKVTVDGAETELIEGEKFVLPEKKENGFIGYEIENKLYFAGEEITVNYDIVVTTVTFNIEYLGSSIRLSDPSGIRFSYKIDKAAFDSLSEKATVEVGAIVIPTDLLKENEELNLTTDKVARTGKIDFTEKETAKYYNAVLKGIPENKYEREFSARAFVTVTVNGKTVIVYYEIAQNSIKGVAASALADDSANFTAEETLLLKKFAGEE